MSVDDAPASTPSGSRPAPERVPTLTEVVVRPAGIPPRAAGAVPAPAAVAVVSAASPEPRPAAAAGVAAPAGMSLAVAPASPAATAAPAAARAEPVLSLRVAEGQIIEGVLLQLQRQVDLMLEYRLREVLTPLLARAADGVVRDARGELASTLRDVVARAVTEELAKHRGRAG